MHKGSPDSKLAGTAAGKAAWQHVQYSASASRRRTISTAGKQHLQQQPSSQLSQQQQVRQQSSYATSFDPYNSSSALGAGYSHDYAGSGGAAAAGCRLSDSSSGGRRSVSSDGSSCSSTHVSIRVKQSGGGTAAAAAADLPRELELLKGVSGHAVPGKLMALMGGSGAGEGGQLSTACIVQVVEKVC
jgi:hypothetical protein